MTHSLPGCQHVDPVVIAEHFMLSAICHPGVNRQLTGRFLSRNIPDPSGGPFLMMFALRCSVCGSVPIARDVSEI